MTRPRNIILIVADSLRYDSIQAAGPDAGLPWTTAHATRFTQARSAGCWTLPATASLFTGLMPHEHGATSQTRGVRSDVPTLAELLRNQGYSTHQVTANVATTHIFGLHRGFDEVRRIWKHVPSHHKKVHEAVVLVGKPRLRKRIFSKDFVMGKMSEDLEASKVWLQSTAADVFDHTRQVLRENENRGRGSFCFVNLMESHFPYHVGSTFETTVEGAANRLRELYSLFHLVNQTWLRSDHEYITPPMLEVLRRRQRMAWARLASQVDAFVEELAQDGENLVIFCSDHGDNFGEQGWLYHFSNVTDAGNRVPLFYVRPGQQEPHTISTPVSARDLFHTILAEAGSPEHSLHLCDEPERSLPVMQSYWYNNQGQTLPRYRFNQIALLESGRRYMQRRGTWYAAPPQGDGTEPRFVALPRGIEPIEEIRVPAERRAAYRQILSDYAAFSSRVAA